MQKLNRGTCEMQNEEETISFELIGHKMFVRTRIDDSRVLNFIFDTGALTMIDMAVAEELEIDEGIQIPSLDTLNRTCLSKDDVTIHIGNVSIRDFIPVLGVLPTGDSLEPRVDGFIGSDLLRFFCVTIDYQNQKILLSKKSPKIGEIGHRSKLEKFLPLGFPLITCTIPDNRQIRLMIDTGSPFSLVFPLAVMEGDGIFADEERIRSIGNFMKWPSTKAGYNYATVLNLLKFGELEIKDFLVFAAELPGMFLVPLLGKAFLENFITTIDFLENEVILWEKTNPVKTPKLSAGFCVRRSGDGVFVKGIWENSPADRNGVHVDDEITAINGQGTKNMPTHEIQSILDDDTIQEIKIKKAKQEIIIRLKKVSLVSLIQNQK